MQARFRGLTLTDSDRERLGVEVRRRDIESWRYKRCRALLLLDGGRRISDVRRALGCADHNVRRWVRTYQAEGLDAALSRHYRSTIEKCLSPSEEQRLIALCCSGPPEGRARWTVRLLSE